MHRSASSAHTEALQYTVQKRHSATRDTYTSSLVGRVQQNFKNELDWRGTSEVLCWLSLCSCFVLEGSYRLGLKKWFGIKSTGHYSKGPSFYSQHTYSRSQLSNTLFWPPDIRHTVVLR